jgi:hypothetical protein
VEKLFEFPIAEALHSFWPTGCNLSGNPHLTDKEHSCIKEADCCLPLLGCEEEEISRGVAIIDHIVSTHIVQFRVCIENEIDKELVRNKTLVECSRAVYEFPQENKEILNSLPHQPAGVPENQLLPRRELTMIVQTNQQNISPTEAQTMDLQVYEHNIPPLEPFRAPPTIQMRNTLEPTPSTIPTIHTAAIAGYLKPP